MCARRPVCGLSRDCGQAQGGCRACRGGIEVARNRGYSDFVGRPGGAGGEFGPQAGRFRGPGDLLPEGKMEILEALRGEPGKVTAFVGDGFNDAPALATSDVGVAMGALGSDAAIETADVVIQSDQPSRLPAAIRIGRLTHRIVRQNILLAIGVKVVVLTLGALGIATMWEAVFADVGVTLLAVLNAVRASNRRF